MSTTERGITLSGGYPYQGLDRLIHLLGPILELERRTRVTLDLRNVIFMGPSALALLTAALKRLVEMDLLVEGHIHLPDAEPLSRYLARMDFVKILVGDGSVEAGEEPPHGFTPCRHFRTDAESQVIARELADAIGERCVVDHAARQSINICLNELAENVTHHSESQFGGIAACGGWSRANILEVGMVDLGRGIRASLTNNPDYADIPDDVTAITTALEPRVTATPTRNSGIGLFVTRLLLRENRGLFLVRSGIGAVYSGARERQAAVGVRLPGTLVLLRARTDRPLNIARDVYPKLDDEANNRNHHGSTE